MIIESLSEESGWKLAFDQSYMFLFASKCRLFITNPKRDEKIINIINILFKTNSQFLESTYSFSEISDNKLGYLLVSSINISSWTANVLIFSFQYFLSKYNGSCSFMK